MKAGDVFLGSDYATLLLEGRTELPEQAKSGLYALGTTIMVASASLHEDIREVGLSEWFPARVCLPPPVAGQWYRWYDPFIWYEAEGPIHVLSDAAPRNMAYVGSLWHEPYVSSYTGELRTCEKFWCIPIDKWREVCGQYLVEMKFLREHADGTEVER